MSKELFIQAKKVIPGGVNSPVRAFKGLSRPPVFFQRGQGSYLFDTNNKKYIDYVASWGPMILGHAHPEVIKAVQKAAEHGLSFGAPTILETKMAELLIQLVPSMEKVRLVNSGTEAAMSAIRLSRGYTGRDKIVKFEGCYHGHADSLLVKAGSGALTLGVPNSPGVPADLAQHTIISAYNNIEQIQHIYTEIGDQIAAIIVEPIAGNMNCIPAQLEFLRALRKLCDTHGSILIFDEVMSGFRVALGGAQSVYNIAADITILGKIIGGGLPVGAFGGHAAIMDELAPDGPVYQAGTLSGNPIALSAGLKTLQLIMERPDFFVNLAETTKMLVSGITSAAKKYSIPMSYHQQGGMFGLFFSNEKNITCFDHVMKCNQSHFHHFFSKMLDAGIYFAPSPYEAGFVSQAHSSDDILNTITHAENIFMTMQNLA